MTLKRFPWPQSAFAVVIAVVAVTSNACSSSATATTAPTSLKCGIALNTASVVDASGGTGTIEVAAEPECAWIASTPATWIVDLSPTSGQGNGQITFRATANPQIATRDGEIAVNDARARITQQGAPCRYDLSPGGREISSAADSGRFDIVTEAGCSWTATSSVPWISITRNASGSGTAAVSYAVQANSGAPRSGGITVADQTFAINQQSDISTCTYNLSSTSVAVSAETSSGSVTITTGTSCAWTAASNAPWITLTGGTSGMGNGVVSYSVLANTGAARSGTISLAGRSFTVNQADGTPGCSYQLSSSGTSVGAAATSGSVNVSTGSGCGWTAMSNASWITVTGGAAGIGNGAVTFNISANRTGAPRSGTIAIAGHIYTVEQASSAPSCTYQLSPTLVPSPIAAAGGSGSFDVIAPSGCPWTATRREDWITFSGATMGSGNGVVSFTVAANPAPSTRSGVITVEGQTFTINQSAAAAPSCTYRLDPTTVASPIAAAGGSGSFNVIAPSGCGWRATSREDWITFSGATMGSGNGVVSFTVAANTASNPRSGVITVAGQTFTVNQAAAASCTYSLSSSSASVNRAGNPAPSFTVLTGAGCSWRAVSNVPWITADPSSGTGSGTVTLDVGMNREPSRSGTVTVAGQTFTVNQSGRDDNDAF